MASTSRSSFASLAPWILILAHAAFSAGGQEPQAVIQVETVLVNVPVFVADREGRHIANLRVQDFALFEDGVRQPIAHFATSEEDLNVALLLDTSQSTRRVLGDIKKAAAGFLKQLRPQDRAMAVSFDYEVRTLCPFGSDRKALEAGIKRAKVGERVGTKLRDAVLEVASGPLRELKGRKAIVLLTDGQDAGSRISEERLLDAISELDAVIYDIFYTPALVRGGMQRIPRGPFPPPRGLGGRRRPGLFDPFPPVQPPPMPKQPDPRRLERIRRGEEYLEELAVVTGGFFYRSEVANLKKVFQQITDELHHEYLLGYYPALAKLDGKPHRLGVRVARPGLAVRCRQSYTARRRS